MIDEETLKSVFELLGTPTEEQLIDYVGLTKGDIEELMEKGIIFKEGDYFTLLEKESTEKGKSGVDIQEEEGHTPKEVVKISLDDLAAYISRHNLDSNEAEEVIKNVYRKAGYTDPKSAAKTAIYQLFGRGNFRSISGDASTIEEILGEREESEKIRRGRKGGLWDEVYKTLTEVYSQEEIKEWGHREAVEKISGIFKNLGYSQEKAEKAASNFYYQKLRKEIGAKQKEGITRGDIAAYLIANDISDQQDILDIAKKVYTRDGKKVPNAYSFMRAVVEAGRLEEYAKKGNPNKVSELLEKEIETPPQIQPLERLIEIGEKEIAKEIADTRIHEIQESIETLKKELRTYQQFKRKYNL